MKKLLLSLLAFMALCVSVQAQEAQEKRCDGAFAVDDVEIAPGDQITMTFKLTDLLPNAGKEYEGSRGFQFDLYLPEGFSLAKYQGEIDALMSATQEPDPRRPKWMLFGSPQDQEERHIMFVCTTMGNNLLCQGDVFEVVLVADESVEEGIYYATVAGNPIDRDIDISGKDGGDAWVQAPFKIRIFVPRLELSEEKDYLEGFDDGLTNVNVTMNTRTLKANTWNTICLPFSMDKDQIAAAFPNNNVTIAEFTECKPNADNTHLSLKFNSISSDAGMAANTPYLIKVSTGVTTFTVEGTSFEALDEGKTSPEVEVNDCKFIGNYKNLSGSELNNKIFLSGNKFYISQGNTSLKSFRGYFSHPILETSGANVSLFVDDEPTGISTLTTNQDNNDIYDISGRKVNSDKTPLQKGIYIINGKKETVH